MQLGNISSSGNGRIIKRILANKDISMTFSIAKAKRNNNGTPDHITLAKIGVFRASEFGSRYAEFWEIADEVLLRLVNDGTLMVNDAHKIRRQFEAIIPRRPALAVKYWASKKPTTRV